MATGAITDAMGPNPNGYIAYQTDGRMMALVVDRHTRQPGAQAASDADKAALLNSMLAYSATYRIEGDHVIHTVDAAWHPAWCGGLNHPSSSTATAWSMSGAPGRDPRTGNGVVNQHGVSARTRRSGLTRVGGRRARPGYALVAPTCRLAICASRDAPFGDDL